MGVWNVANRTGKSRPSADGLRSLDDRDLLTFIAGGDPEALAAIYDRHIGSVWKLALMSCDDKSAAERVVRDIFLELWRRPWAGGSKPPVVRLLAGVRASCD
jgi:hypothetical protein